ncbi:MAG: ATP-binding protein [Lachnospiraceae bacterium]|nr:ATP-binding protein [Lachnospiraceae bacterium]
MGYYLNPEDVLELYKGETEKPYFVDKTAMLEELITVLGQGRSYISVTRPRRFGKSVVAAMIGSFFGKGVDSNEVFAHLKVAGNKAYAKHLNQHNLIYIDFSRDVFECTSYDEYIKTIKMRLFDDLKEAYPDAKIREGDSLGATLRIVSMANKNEKFLLVFDEWDYVFHRKYFTEEDRGKFTAFLGDITKGRAYVEMAYLTGVLPIKKYSASDTMNHFAEYNMANSIRFWEYFGFTNAEVDELYQRYQKFSPAPVVSREDLTDWYDGYHNERKESIYNPNSVVLALTENMVSDYWPKAGEYDELKDYVLNDIDGVRDAVMLLAAGEPVKANISEYATTASVLKRRNEILSAMTVYGYLNYYNGCVRIPNRELWEEFNRIIQEEPKYSYMRELEKESARILQATYDGDEETVGKVLAIVHTTESPLKAYRESLAMQNRALRDGSAYVHDSRWKSWTYDEAELSGSVKLAYIAARNKYDMQREDQAGIGYVDYIFYPYNRSDDGIIIELKVDDSPETALQQIKDKNYALKFQGKMGEQPKTTGRIILVGIGYYRKDKVHRCRIEVL